jgi:hypothetical protein
MTTNIPTPKTVEDLSQYGKALDDIPEEAKKAQERIVMEMIKLKYGWFGRFPFFIKMYSEQRRLKKQYAQSVEQLRFVGTGASEEFLMLVAMFNIFARTDGREDAGASIIEMFQKVAAEAGMAALYQLDELVGCEGDVYDNFTKFNIAMFEGSQHLYDSTHTVDPDKHTISVTRCANVEFADAFDCPELRSLGCNFDIGGYPVIEDEVNVEFRRPITIANGDDRCAFSFYRKGTAPETEEIDGKTVKWESHLNR